MEQTVIPNNLKEYRKKAALTQMEVAHRLGFTSAERISEWEKGISYPHILNVFKLCVVYNAFPHDLFGELFNNLKKEIQKE